MKCWTTPIVKYTRSEVDIFCVLDPKWQTFRRALKGLPTEKKLDRLDQYLVTDFTRRAQVQVSNYINALKRGGQLNRKNEVVR